MKKKLGLIILWLSLTSCVGLYSQNVVREFKKIETKDFEVKAPEDDPDAEAIVLFDIGKTRFYDTGDGLNIKFTRITRILILKESGLDWAEISIPLYKPRNEEPERLQNLKASSYNMVDGGIHYTELDNESIFEERINENWIRKTFAMPAVKVGTIIEYEYQLISPYVVNLPDWEFQNRIPTLYSRYEVGITPFYEYTFLLQGTKSVDSYKYVDELYEKSFYTTKYHDRVHEFIMENIPAFKDESYITSVQDYIIKIDFQLSRIWSPYGASTDFLTTWEAMNEKFYKHDDFGGFIKKSEKIANKIFSENLSIDGLDDRKKCKLIVDYVKENFSWNGRDRKFAEKSPKDFLKEASGSNSEINLFLVGMLRAAGINAKPVLISTRDHGRIRTDYPYAHLFNYVIVIAEVKGRFILTDGTDPLLAYSRIPSRCINHQGLIINKDEEAWVNVTNSMAFPSSVYKEIKLKVDLDELVINCEFNNQSNEYLALKNKKSYGRNPDLFIESLENKGFENVDDIMAMNLKVPGKPFIINYKANYPLDYFEDKILVAPFLNLPISENELKQPERLYPVDMNYKKNWKYNSLIDIPEGHQILKTPEDFLMDNAIMKIELKSEKIGKYLAVTGIIEYKKAVYPPEDYKKLRSYINIIIKRFNDKIVFKEIPNDTGDEVNAE